MLNKRTKPTRKKTKPSPAKRRACGTVRHRPEDFHFITAAEHKAILSNYSATRYPIRNRTLYLFWYYCGLRISESLSINIEQVFDGAQILPNVEIEHEHTKNKTGGRTIPLRDPNFILRNSLMALVKERKKQADFSLQSPLFISERGNRLDRVTAWREFKSVLAKAGLDKSIRPHDGRHTAITRVNSISKNIVMARDFAGHLSIESTNRYAKSTVDELATVMSAHA